MLNSFFAKYRDIIILVSAIVVLIIVFFVGVKYGNSSADSKYLKDREVFLKRIVEAEKQSAIFEAAAAENLKNEQRLSDQNDLLRTQAEMSAKVLEQSDAKLSGDGSKLLELVKQRQDKLDSIDLDTNFDSQRCGMCEDLAKAGFPLSDSTCKLCKNHINK